MAETKIGRVFQSTIFHSLDAYYFQLIHRLTQVSTRLLIRLAKYFFMRGIPNPALSKFTKLNQLPQKVNETLRL
jgi:hypothetical protein